MIKKTDKTLLSVTSIHTAIIAAIAVCGMVFHDTHTQVASEVHKIETMPSQTITSTVSSEQVEQTIEKFRAMKTDAMQKELEQRKEIDDLKRESAQRNRSVASKKAELNDISRQIEKQKLRLEELRKKKLADLKRKKRLAEQKRIKDLAVAAEKKAAELRKKKKVEDEKRRVEAENRRIAAEKAAKIREKERQMQIAAAAAARKDMLDRSKYEGEIYNSLFGAWSLPYVRSNVKCSVRLSVAKDGEITGYAFITPCPDMYKSSITTAINNIGRFDINNPKSYRSTEIVNFLDNLSNQSVG